MHNVLLIILSSFFICAVSAQKLPAGFRESVRKLESDAQLGHAMLGLYIVDGKTGQELFDKNAQVGMPPASSQKIITSAAAFELLGKDYRYETTFGYEGSIDKNVLMGNIRVSGSGDPTFGSWRWEHTKESRVLQRCLNEIKKAGIGEVNGGIVADVKNWSTATVPDGWIWQDIGNYYGAGTSSLNWRENQYDLVLSSGNKAGDPCAIVATKPTLYDAVLTCEVITAAKGSGDHAFIYLPPYAQKGFVRGTIPAGETAFTVSGSFPNSAAQFIHTLDDMLKNSGIKTGKAYVVSVSKEMPVSPLFTHVSPPLDSIIYWFMKKSINMYGEALMKTMALQKNGFASTEKGVDIVKYFWSQRGIEKSALNIFDGSGLSPQDRVTPQALVKVLQYAKSRPWFSSFYQALPEINGISMKSGSIEGTRSYTGYIKSKTGNEYSFAIIVCNYEGSAAEIVRKMWSVLDTLK